MTVSQKLTLVPIALLFLAPVAHATAVGDACDPTQGFGCSSGQSCVNNVCVASGSSQSLGTGSVSPTPSQSLGTGTVNPNSGSQGDITLVNPLKAGTSLPALLADVLQIITTIGTVVIVLMIVLVGFKFVTAQGAPGKIEEAKKMLLYTLIGALILLGAQTIALMIQSTVSALGG